MKNLYESVPNPHLDYNTYFRKSCRTLVYDPSVDEEFVKWVMDPKTAAIETRMSQLYRRYKLFHSRRFGLKHFNKEGLRRHINEIFRSNGLKMRSPKVIEAKRYVKYETLRLFFHNTEVIRSLKNFHPEFLFNSDETNVSVKGSAPGKVASKQDERPFTAAEDRTTSHVYLFLSVSAAGHSSWIPKGISPLPKNNGTPKGVTQESFIHSLC